MSKKKKINLTGFAEVFANFEKHNPGKLAELNKTMEKAAKQLTPEEIFGPNTVKKAIAKHVAKTQQSGPGVSFGMPMKYLQLTLETGKFNSGLAKFKFSAGLDTGTFTVGGAPSFNLGDDPPVEAEPYPPPPMGMID